MIHWFKQWRCKRRGHPYPTSTVDIVGRFPHQPGSDVTYCTGCGAKLYEEFYDNAGSERTDS